MLLIINVYYAVNTLSSNIKYVTQNGGGWQKMSTNL